MRRTLLIILSAAVTLSLSAQSEKKITILHTNDLHAHIEGFAPESDYSPSSVNDDKTVGGFSRIATIIKREKESATGTTLVLDAGDFLMGTLFQSLETKNGFQLRLMKTMGYDVACLGNHEFDYGPEKLAAIISSAKKNGEIPPLLLSNAVFSEKESGDNTLEELFNDNTIGRKLMLTRDGIKIGFFSLMGVVADDNAALAPPVTFSRQIPMARKMVKELQNENCDIIICLSHSGVSADGRGGWEGEDVELAEKVAGIDVIISGHTHTFLEKPLLVNGIPVVQTGEYGRNIGKLSLTIKNGNVSVDGYTLIPVDDKTAGDMVVQKLIEDQKLLIDSEILTPLGMKYSNPVAESDFLLECDEMGDIKGSNLGPMVADAIHSYVNNHSDKGTDVSMVAVGVIRDRIVPGKQSAADIFRIMSMGTGNDPVPGYPLSRLYVTGKELRSILEILQVAYKSTPGNYCYYSGIRVEYNPEKGMLKKIRKVEILHPDGKVEVVDFSKKNKTLYSVTANSYMLEFIGIIKKMSFGLINVVPKDVTGARVTDMKNAVIDMDSGREGVQEGKEWLALMEMISLMKDTNGNGIPDLNIEYKEPVKNFFEVK
ncbi:MAG: bifunctional metallophosphatase/5'-nucleotidase [Bacteroidales bacterium]|nr:bifunctional metallophosphatase/5'-nucleotidase [Bacteroidales bacterium]